MKKKAGKQRIQEIRQIQKPKLERKKWQFEENSGFKIEFCQMLVNHCSEGYSFQSFAVRINVLPKTLDEWAEEYPEFAKARTIAALKQKIFWEMKAVEACSEKFSYSIFRYFTENDKDKKPEAPQGVVLLPNEVSTK